MLSDSEKNLEKKILDRKTDIIDVIEFESNKIEGQFPALGIPDIRTYFNISESEANDKDILLIFQKIFSDKYILSMSNGNNIAFRKKPVVIPPTEVIKTINISVDINNDQIIALGPSVFEMLHGIVQIPVHSMDTTLKYGAFKHFNILEKIIEYMSDKYNLSEKEMVVSIYQQILLREHKYEHILREGVSYHLKDHFTTTNYFKALVFIINREYIKGEIFVIPFLEDEFFKDMDKQLVQIPKQLGQISFKWYYAFRFRLKDIDGKYSEMYKLELYEYLAMHEKIMKDIGMTEKLTISPGAVIPEKDLRFHLAYLSQEELNIQSFKTFIEDIERLIEYYLSSGLSLVGYGKIDIDKSETIEKW